MVNKPLARPAIFGGGTLGEGRLTSQDKFEPCPKLGYESVRSGGQRRADSK